MQTVIEILGRVKIRSLLCRTYDMTGGHSLSRNSIFLSAWSIFLIIHFVVYATKFDAPLYPTTFLIPIVGVALLYRPSAYFFCASVLILLIDGILQMPFSSNHTMLKNVVVLGFVSAYPVTLWFRRRGRDLSYYDVAAPIGRSALLVMYFFGVFHKINTDFLNPEVGCATALWLKMPLGISSLWTPWIGYGIAYGTLIVESLLILMLITKPYRNHAVVLGVAFHGFLGISGYAFYPAFSTLTVALHLLFLSQEDVKKIQLSSVWLRAKPFFKSPLGVAATMAWLAGIFLLAYSRSYGLAGLLWFCCVVVLVYLLLASGFVVVERGKLLDLRTLVSPARWLNLVPILFFLNCFAPYLGLKTAQTMNMFANLRLEGGVNNHLVMRHVPPLFGYLDDTVKLAESSGDAYLDYVAANNLGLVYYGFLNRLERNPSATVSFYHNHQLYEQVGYQNLKDDADKILHPRWFRAWFHFNVVDFTEPKPCAPNR